MSCGPNWFLETAKTSWQNEVGDRHRVNAGRGGFETRLSNSQAFAGVA